MTGNTDTTTQIEPCVRRGEDEAIFVLDWSGSMPLGDPITVHKVCSTVGKVVCLHPVKKGDIE